MHQSQLQDSRTTSAAHQTSIWLSESEDLALRLPMLPLWGSPSPLRVQYGAQGSPYTGVPLTWAMLDQDCYLSPLEINAACDGCRTLLPLPQRTLKRDPGCPRKLLSLLNPITLSVTLGPEPSSERSPCCGLSVCSINNPSSKHLAPNGRFQGPPQKPAPKAVGRPPSFSW